ncbi:hypothetical protein IMCC21224_15193 [Puniceibacterium sp. IMCC21224]|nr:hypothetical protein IMCC21224_15193 [Puniceibacterium sp. IMCC21224]
MQTKQIVDQALQTPNSVGGGTGAFAEGRAAPGADLMRHKTLLAERSQSLSARRAPVSKPTTVTKARNACRQAPASAKIGRFVFRQTGRAELQPGRLRLWCATLLRRCPQGQTQPGKGSGAMVRAAMSSKGMWYVLPETAECDLASLDQDVPTSSDLALREAHQNSAEVCRLRKRGGAASSTEVHLVRA